MRESSELRESSEMRESSEINPELEGSASSGPVFEVSTESASSCIHGRQDKRESVRVSVRAVLVTSYLRDRGLSDNMSAVCRARDPTIVTLRPAGSLLTK